MQSLIVAFLCVVFFVGHVVAPAPPPPSEFLCRYHPQMCDAVKRDVKALNKAEVARRVNFGDSRKIAFSIVLCESLTSFQTWQMLVLSSVVSI